MLWLSENIRTGFSANIAMTPERLEKIKRVLDRRYSDLTVVLDGVYKERNHAAIVRTCDAVGIQRLHLVSHQDEHKPFRGTAMGSHHWVDVVLHDTIDNALDRVRSQKMQVVIASGEPEARHYKDIDFSRPTALVLGAEHRGVSSFARDDSDAMVAIPMRGMVQSYNVSVAAAIILNEAREQRSKFHGRGVGLSIAERQHYFFRWAYPRLAEFCDARAIPYPTLTEEGDIIDPDGRWREFAKSREQ